ncbi:MAG: methionyl-tRNA formyltransferase [Bacteroidia bacterium]
MRIVFLGTPAFAVESLKAIIQNGFNVVGVVTAPDKPAGRGMKLQQSPVKQYALSQKIPVLQPVKLKDASFIEQLKSLKADLQVVIAFRMLPEIVWNMPPMGTINLHASLLPDYRGAAPINWAIINGEKKTGVTTFFLKHEIDTGDMLLQAEVDITNDMNAGQLHDLLMVEGAKVVVQSLKLIQSGNYQTIPQSGGSSKIAPKIFTETCRINWEKNALEIYNLVRGLSPYPTAFCEINYKKIKVFACKPEIAYHRIGLGIVETDNKTFLKVSCNDGYIHLTEVQAESKKRMPIEEFLKGFRL